MSKVAIIFLTIVSLGVSGCDTEDVKEARKNQTFIKDMALRSEDYPYCLGDVVSLKPDKTSAVIEAVASFIPTGSYEIIYDSEGDSFTIIKLIAIKELKYNVRYPVKQEHTKTHILDQDEPTQTLHYQSSTVNWYEIYGKIETPK